MIQSVVRALDRLAGMFSGRFATAEPTIPAPKTADPLMGTGGAGLMSRMGRLVKVPTNREAELEFYDQIEMEMPEIPRALEAFATMAATGSITGLSRGSYTIRVPDDAPEKLRAWMKTLEKVFRRSSFTIIRGMSKYGSFPTDMKIAPIDGKLGIVDLPVIPPATITRIIQGGRSDDAKYWERTLTGGKDILPRWRIPHFALWTQSVTATEYLLFGISLLRPVAPIALKVGACVDSSVVSRLTRAAMRLAWTIDCQDIPTDTARILARLDMYRDSIGRDRQVTVDGRLDSMARAVIPDEDIFLPGGPNLGFKVEPIEGDSNLARITDIELLFRIYFGALGVPPEYLGHERSQGGRSTLNQVDVNFARTSRHIQMFGAAGFDHVIYVHMLLGGFDPERYPCEAVPPPIGARDDMLAAQIRLLNAQVLQTLTAAGFDPSVDPRWTVRAILQMDDDIAPLTDEILNRMFIMPLTVVTEPTPSQRGGRKTREYVEIMRTGTEWILENIKFICGVPSHQDGYNYGAERPDPALIRQGVIRDIMGLRT